MRHVKCRTGVLMGVGVHRQVAQRGFELGLDSITHKHLKSRPSLNIPPRC